MAARMCDFERFVLFSVIIMLFLSLYNVQDVCAKKHTRFKNRIETVNRTGYLRKKEF